MRQSLWKKSGESARGAPTLCVPVTATTYCPWRPCSTPGHLPAMSASEAGRDRDHNLAGAFGWSAKTRYCAWSQLASSCNRLWRTRGRIGRADWFDADLTDANAHPASVARRCAPRALADKASAQSVHAGHRQHEQASKPWRSSGNIDDPDVLLRALTACSSIAVYTRGHGHNAPRRSPWTRSIGEVRAQPQILMWQAYGSVLVGIRSRCARPPKKDATSRRVR